MEGSLATNIHELIEVVRHSLLLLLDWLKIGMNERRKGSQRFNIDDLVSNLPAATNPEMSEEVANLSSQVFEFPQFVRIFSIPKAFYPSQVGGVGFGA